MKQGSIRVVRPNGSHRGTPGLQVTFACPCAPNVPRGTFRGSSASATPSGLAWPFLAV